MKPFPFNLRDYQQKVVSDVYSLIRQSVKRILIFAPTGAGKTIIITKIIYDAVSRNKKVLFVVHRDILVKQTADKLKVLRSCSALSEGFDVPEVSCVMLARPTKSKALYFQQLGRGLRLAEEKRDCLILDQSRNVMVHGFIEDLEKVELFSSENSDRENPGKPPLKICPKDDGGCGVYIHSGRPQCPHCGYNFDLKKIITILGRNQLLSVEDRAGLTFYRSLLREAYRKNYAPTWAAVKFKERYGFFPPFDWARGAIFDDRSEEIEVYKKHLAQIAQRLDKDRDWIDKYLYLEFGQQNEGEVSNAA